MWSVPASSPAALRSRADVDTTAAGPPRRFAVLLLGPRPPHVADVLGRTARVEEGTCPAHEVVRPTHTSEIVRLDGVHHVARVRVHPALAIRAAGERRAFGHFLRV